MMPVQPPALNRAQRYALGKVAMRTLEGKSTSDAQYPKYAPDFAFLARHSLIETTPAGSYVLTPAGAREIQTWQACRRPVSHSALSEYIRDYNAASLYGEAS